MQMTYADIQVLIERDRWIDRAPKMPLVGFVIGSGLSLALWAALVTGAWIILA
jgi:hypothetical protein